MQHLDEGTIHAWLDGALDQRESDDIARHVAACAACAARVADERGVIAGASRIVASLDVVRGNVIPAHRSAAPVSLWRRLRLTPARAALAASILVAASAMLAVRHDTADKMVLHRQVFDAPRVASAPVAASAPPAAETVATRESVPVDSVRSRPRMEDRNVNAAAAGAFAPSHGVAQMRVLAAGAPPQTNCYRLDADSTRFVKELPPRFALDHDDLGRNIVRSVTPAGKIDSVLIGTDWQNRPPILTVRFAAPTPVSLSFTANETHARASSGAETRTVAIHPTDCRP